WYTYHLSSLCCFYHRPASPRIYTLSLHDALPIFLTTDVTRQNCTRMAWDRLERVPGTGFPQDPPASRQENAQGTILTSCPHLLIDRKSTRLNSSHVKISYAVFCLKKKTTQSTRHT